MPNFTSTVHQCNTCTHSLTLEQFSKCFRLTVEIVSRKENIVVFKTCCHFPSYTTRLSENHWFRENALQETVRFSLCTHPRRRQHCTRFHFRNTQIHNHSIQLYLHLALLRNEACSMRPSPAKRAGNDRWTRPDRN